MTKVGSTSGIGAPLSANRIGGDNFIRYIGDRVILDFHEGGGMTVRDLSGNGNNGRIQGITELPIWERNCLNLDGIDDYINIPDSDSLTPDNFLSFGCYFRTSQIASSIPISKEFEYAFSLIPNFPYMWLNDINLANFISVDDLFPPTYWDNIWHDWCCLWSGGKTPNSLEMYFDGLELRNLLPSSGGTFNSIKNMGTDLNIGYYRIAFPEWWQARISFIRINMMGMSKSQILWDYFWNKWRN